LTDPVTARPVDVDARQLFDPYPGQKVGRRVELAVSWVTKEIARDLGPHLKSLVYIDNLSGAADDLALTVEDRDSLWSGDWKPTFGDKVVARLKWADAWFGNKVTDLRLGTFAHDKIRLSGPPRIATLSCVSAPMSSGLRRRKHTKAWRGVTLKQIAQDIADRAGMQLDFDGAPGGVYAHALQHDKSDLEFLEHECKQVGRTVKVTESKIVIFEEHALDGRAASGDIDLIGGKVLTWDFDADDGGRYSSCHVTCFNPRSGKKIEYEFPPKGVTIPGLEDNGQTLELAISVSDAAEAAKRAESLLRNANRFATSGTISTVGDPGLVAGVTFNLTNAGGLSGKFIVTRAEHHIVGGYTTSLGIRRTLEGY
jgi:phage protein D